MVHSPAMQRHNKTPLYDHRRGLGGTRYFGNGKGGRYAGRPPVAETVACGMLKYLLEIVFIISEKKCIFAERWKMDIKYEEADN